jgi:hypothetical protein
MPLLECQNCGFLAESENFNTAQNIEQRHSPGDTFSDKECPHCGALGYPVEDEQESIDELVHDVISQSATKITNSGRESALEFIDTAYGAGETSRLPEFIDTMSMHINKESYYKARAEFFEEQAGKYFNALKML